MAIAFDNEQVLAMRDKIWEMTQFDNENIISMSGYESQHPLDFDRSQKVLFQSWHWSRATSFVESQFDPVRLEFPPSTCCCTYKDLRVMTRIRVASAMVHSKYWCGEPSVEDLITIQFRSEDSRWAHSNLHPQFEVKTKEGWLDWDCSW